MRKSLLFICILATSFCFGQTKVNERFENVSMLTAIQTLEQSYNVKLSYDPDLLKEIKVTVSLQNMEVEEALSTLFSNTQLSFTKNRRNSYAIGPSRNIWKIKLKLKDEDGQGIPYAKIRVIGTYKGVIANENGEVNFEYASDQAPLLEISSLGFEKVQLKADELSLKTEFTLKVDAITFDEVLVEHITEGISQGDDVSKITLRPQKIGAVPGTTDPDVFQMVQNVPGINSASSTVSEIQIRGGTADQNHLIWDGIPIYHPGHFNGMISSLNPNIIEKTDVHRGVYDPYFGGKASGLINLKSIRHIPEKMKYGAGINLMQGDAYVIAPIKEKVAVLFSARRSYTDLWRSPTYNSFADRVYQETEILNDGVYTEEPEFTGMPGTLNEITNTFYYYDLNGKVIYKPNSQSLLTVSSLFTNNRLDYSSEFNEGEEILNNFVGSSNKGLSIDFDHQINDFWKTSLLGAWAQYEYNFDQQYLSVEEEIEVEESFFRSNFLNHLSFKWNNEIQLNTHHKVSAGYQVFQHSVQFSISEGEDSDTISETGSNDGFTHAINTNYQFKKDRWLIKAGTRLAYLTTTDLFYFEPRLYAQYRFNEWLIGKAAFGVQNQFISQVDQFDFAQLGLSNRIWVFANDESIPVVNSQVSNVGFVIRHKGWLVEIDGYYKLLSNIVNFSNDPSLSSGLIRGDATAIGADFMIKKRWKDFRSWISYSFADVEYYFPDFAQSNFKAPFNQLHTVKWVNTFSWKQFEFSSAFKVASGKPYSPIQGVAQTGTPDPDEELDDAYEIVYAGINTKTLPVFHQLDLTIFYSFPKNPDKTWRGRVGVSCFNVYNQTNILSRTYELDEVEDEIGNVTVEPFAIDRYYLRFTPNVLVRFDF